MKPPAKKPAKEEPAKPSRIAPKDFPHALAQYEDKLISLGLEFENLQKEAYPKVRTIIEGALPQLTSEVASLCRGHSDRVEAALLRNILEFLNIAPIWETKFVPGMLTMRNEVEQLYRQGWRYLTSCHDPKTGVGGSMYHRPTTPGTFEEFKKMYEKMLVDRTKQEASLKQREKYYAEQAAKKKQAIKNAEEGVAEPVEETEEAPKKVAKKPLVKLKAKAKS